MKKCLSVFAIIGMLFLIASQALAVTIVDTGPGPSVGGGWTLADDQWLAAKFSVNQAYTIREIYGWMNDSSGSLTFALYSDNGTQVPGAELFSRQINNASPGVNSDWVGVSDFSWIVNPGTYWLSFEVRSGDTYRGAMPDPSPSPLADEAFWNGSQWRESDSLDLGIRITDNVTGGSPIPEPATMLLLGLSLMGLAGIRRKMQ